MRPHRSLLELPVTTSVKVTEEKGTYLGLDGVGILYVFGLFIGVNLLSRGNVPMATVSALLLYLILRVYLTGKPKNFLLYALLYPFRPKHYRHQCRLRREVLRCS